MDNGKNKKTEPWRVIAFIVSAAFIVFMWVKNDVAAVYTGVPSEQILPLIATTIAVSLAKVAAIAAGILLLKWVIRKAKK